MKKLFSKLLGKTKQEPSPVAATADYSHVKSVDQAIELHAEGKLFKILLFPAEFGGEDIPPNIVYVPPGIPEAREFILGSLLRFAEDGLFNELLVEPEYKGDSVVPAKIKIRARHTEKQVREINPTIDIW